MNIKQIRALQIYDSRGNPTVECTVTLSDGSLGRGLVPAGASTGQYEALELRDGNPTRFRGQSVFRAIESIEKTIAPVLLGQDAGEQFHIDQTMIELDGTADKSRLGANAILAVSMAVANAAAAGARLPLYEHIGDGSGCLIPLPQIQLFGGGAHSGWRTDLQDFLIIPVGAQSYAECLEFVYNVYHATGEWMREQGKNFGVAEEGGFWPAFESHQEILEVMVVCIERAGYQPGRDVALALDIAASEMFDGERYRFNLGDEWLSSDDFTKRLVNWCNTFPIISLEDPMADTDIDGWSRVFHRLGDRIQIVGDDLFTTNPSRITEGIDHAWANSVLIKPNQIGTVSETLEAIRLTQQAGWFPIVSARSGETEDTFIAHLAVATNAGQIKVGSFSRSDRMAKWNELLRIECGLSDKARFIGSALFESGPNPLKIGFWG